MKTVLVIGSYAPSLLNFRGPLLTALKAAGCHVHAAAPELGKDASAGLQALGVQPHSIVLSRTGLNPIKDLTSLWSLFRLIRTIRPDVILTYTIKPNIWGALAAALCRVPSYAMITGLGFAFTYQGDQRLNKVQRSLRFIIRHLYRLATSCNTGVIFQNPDDRDDFISEGCLADPFKALMVNGSGVDLSHYIAVPVPKQAHFLMISRLLKSKGVVEYAEASTMVKALYPDARFSLLGYFDDGPDRIDSTQLDAWVSKGLEFQGPKSDVRPALAACSAYVLPSYREGTPRSVLEAMATGRAVLTSDVPGCRDTVIDGKTGYLVPKRDVAALMEKMIMMIEKPDLRSAMGAAGLEYVTEKYDVHKVNTTMLQHMQILR